MTDLATRIEQAQPGQERESFPFKSHRTLAEVDRQERQRFLFEKAKQAEDRPWHDDRGHQSNMEIGSRRLLIAIARSIGHE